MSITAVPLRPIKKGALVKLWIALGLLGAAGVGVAVAQTKIARPFSLQDNGQRHGVVTTASGLEYQVLKAGRGLPPAVNDVAVVNYEGKLTDGSTFDKNKGVPMPLAQVVPGFREALSLMRPGASYRFWIPPALGYGEQDVPDPATGKVVIPGHSVLVFDVDLLKVVPGDAATGMGLPPQ